MKILERFITFLKEVRIELKKVTWLSRRETIRFTVMVILVSIVVAVFLGALDIIFQFILDRFVL